MSGHGTTSFDWGDSTYTFRLGLKEVRELQEKTGIGPLALFNRIKSENWLIDDLRETIRIGLIGGGMKADEALKLIRRYFDDFPKVDQKEPAMKIIGAFLIGDPVDPVGKRAAAGDASGATGASPSPQSTAAGP